MIIETISMGLTRANVRAGAFCWADDTHCGESVQVAGPLLLFDEIGGRQVRRSSARPANKTQG